MHTCSKHSSVPLTVLQCFRLHLMQTATSNLGVQYLGVLPSQAVVWHATSHSVCLPYSGPAILSSVFPEPCACLYHVSRQANFTRFPHRPSVVPILISVIGCDTAGDFLLTQWQSQQLPTNGILQKSQASTPMVSVVFTQGSS